MKTGYIGEIEIVKCVKCGLIRKKGDLTCGLCYICWDDIEIKRWDSSKEVDSEYWIKFFDELAEKNPRLKEICNRVKQSFKI